MKISKRAFFSSLVLGMQLPCGTANYYRCMYLATLVVLLQQWGCRPVNAPLQVSCGILHSCIPTFSSQTSAFQSLVMSCVGLLYSCSIQHSLGCINYNICNSITSKFQRLWGVVKLMPSRPLYRQKNKINAHFYHQQVRVDNGSLW